MVRIEVESFGLVCPSLADELAWGEAAQALEAAGEIVGRDEVVEVPPELVVAVVVEAFDGAVLDGAVHPFDLAVRPGMVDAGEAVLDAVLGAIDVLVTADTAMAHLTGALGLSERLSYCAPRRIGGGALW